ncbi:hypothetical protein D6779_11410 [Candidatus Parcubacteria bacterium]|nr:MAG: hypothetical protein D6779_11410 [Candidatus Parcubacteria bacterium]
MGFAEFSTKLNNPEFAKWFSKLKADIGSLAKENNRDRERRLIALQHALVDLLDFLDPQKMRVPAKLRQRI